MLPEAKICIYNETRKPPPKKKRLNGAFTKWSLQKRACSATAQRLPSVDVQGTGKGHAGEGEKTE